MVLGKAAVFITVCTDFTEKNQTLIVVILLTMGVSRH